MCVPNSLALPHTPESFSQVHVYMNTLFINIIGHFLKKKKGKEKQNCKRHALKTNRDAGLLNGLEESPGPAGTVDLPLQVLAPVTVTGARSCLCAPAPLLGFLGFLFLFFCVCV